MYKLTETKFVGKLKSKIFKKKSKLMYFLHLIVFKKYKHKLNIIDKNFKEFEKNLKQVLFISILFVRISLFVVYK